MPRARPGGVAGGQDERLEERPVEARVVRDDEVSAGDELRRGRGVDGFALEIGVCEAGDPRDLGRERPARILAPGPRVVTQDVRDRALEGVDEGEHRELDDLVAAVVEAGCLAVDEEPAPARARGRDVRLVRERDSMEGAGLAGVAGGARGGGAGHGRVP